MKDFLKFLVTKITGLKDIDILSEEDGSFTNFTVITAPETAGLIIGKEGKTIKAIRNLLKVRATLEKKGVNVSVEEK